MKNHPIILLFLLLSTFGFAQDTNYQFYSYTEFFEMIEEEQDSVFKLEHAIIKFDSIYDTNHSYRGDESIFKEGRTDSIFIKKEIYLNDVHFPSERALQANPYGLHHISFAEKVQIKDSYVFRILNSTFKEHLEISFIDRNPDRHDSYIKQIRAFNVSWVNDNIMLKGFSIISNATRDENSAFSDDDPHHLKQYNVQVLIQRNEISNFGKNRRQHSVFYIHNLVTCHIKENRFLGPNEVGFDISKPLHFSIEDNLFELRVKLRINNIEENTKLSVIGNDFKNYVLFDIPRLPNSAEIEWDQFENKIISTNTFGIRYAYRDWDETQIFSFEKAYSNSEEQNYLNHYRVEDLVAYRKETNLRHNLYEFYKSKYQIDNANGVYRELKDLQTEKLKFVNQQDPSFESFFTWRINQFLKVFSAYGTKPAKAIIFSLYVIFLFSLIYLFFPNSWDKHGKNRIVNRYNFFFKYMQAKAGIHEVYLDDQKEELMSYEQFKSTIADAEQKVPKFFTATALPLYKWAISGTKLSASVLKRIDIMQGSWNELPKSKRIGKSILLIGAFLITILYDIIIKMLNALMLSINTFTTLGFGEIPIKGFPRYLAIIQGFIGWFMLTIFSVSLISQLLN